jgi:hypothetical protein
VVQWPRAVIAACRAGARSPTALVTMIGWLSARRRGLGRCEAGELRRREQRPVASSPPVLSRRLSGTSCGRRSGAA